MEDMQSISMLLPWRPKAQIFIGANCGKLILTVNVFSENLLIITGWLQLNDRPSVINRSALILKKKKNSDSFTCRVK